MDQLKHLSIFIRVAETGSFSRCAQELEIGQPTVSKAIDSLEKELGLKLFNRSTRSTVLTEEGKRILAKARNVLESHQELLSAANSKTSTDGFVRVTCPTALGSLYLIPKLRAFAKKYPGIKVQLNVTDSFLELVENDIDVAFRVGEITHGSFIAKKIGSLSRMAVASEQYLSEHPAPKNLDELKTHSCIVVSKVGSASVWKGTKSDGQAFAAEVEGRYTVDNHLSLSYAVESGLGIGLGAGFLFENNGSLKKGLKQVLAKHQFQPYPVHIVFKQVKNLPARIRLFIDYFTDDLQKQSWITKKN